jgi:hypothetical protein
MIKLTELQSQHQINLAERTRLEALTIEELEKKITNY